MKKKDWIRLVIFILITEAVGFFSIFLSGDIAASYHVLIKPPFSPPEITFVIAWPILYAMPGAAASVIYPEKSERSNRAFMWFLIQMLLSFSWSLIFFRLAAYWIALIIFMLIYIITTYIFSLLKKTNKYASLLLIPYIIGTLFGAYLNLGVALLN